MHWKECSLFDSVEDLKGIRTTTLHCYHQKEIFWALLMQCHHREYSARAIPHQGWSTKEFYSLSNLVSSSHRLGEMWNNLRPSPWNPVDLGLTFRRTWLCRWSGRHVSHSAISGKNATDKTILQSKPVSSLSLERPRWFTDVNAPTALPIHISGKELAGLHWAFHLSRNPY